MAKGQNKKDVLVAVLKSRSDLKILLNEKWYRIPVASTPKRVFNFIAFYQPAVFGKSGMRINYFAKVSKIRITKRITLLPKESTHSGAQKDYHQYEFNKIERLPRPVKNIIPRRVSFGFTDKKSLLNSTNILELYNVPATEKILEDGLKSLGLQVKKEYVVMCRKKRYRIDLVIFCKKGKIAIECDNTKAHSSAVQKQKDKMKDSDLKKLGWKVLRFNEKDIVEDLNKSMIIINRLVSSLGHQS